MGKILQTDSNSRACIMHMRRAFDRVIATTSLHKEQNLARLRYGSSDLNWPPEAGYHRMAHGWSWLLQERPSLTPVSASNSPENAANDIKRNKFECVFGIHLNQKINLHKRTPTTVFSLSLSKSGVAHHRLDMNTPLSPVKGRGQPSI